MTENTSNASKEELNIVEMVTFKLAPGSTEKDFLAANAGIESFIQQQPGFIYRSLCSPVNNNFWTDIVYWQDQASAQAAGQAFMESPLTKPALACIDSATVNMQHLPVIRSQMNDAYGGDAG